MGYRSEKNTGPRDILQSRAIVKNVSYALLPPEGLVKNTVPGFENCDMSILASPKLGATFVDYIVTMLPGGKNEGGFGGDGVETFVFVIDGDVAVTAGEDARTLTKGGYLYCPPDRQMTLKNLRDGESELFLYKRRYRPIGGALPRMVCGNVEELEPTKLDGMDTVWMYDLLPKSIEYDMCFHILSFAPGASHGYIETHVQEHGALILSGEGVYRLDSEWVPVKKGDYIFMGAYAMQAGYAAGTERFSYVYSKDQNRDEEI
ncbi:(S)-ureidoglycine aminohydrolase [Oscillospiraceae bacterium OttesenSCG-928-G22]|nr:(S)-ureidoglycine aminohydrolase [Oscillospiraceae bacterium OttesenSCG-928-G22]